MELRTSGFVIVQDMGIVGVNVNNKMHSENYLPLFVQIK
jgi:hypothetical protein